MEFVGRGFRGLFAVLSLSAAGYGATFGTVVQVRGSVSDIALDERRGNLYIANFSAGRIDVLSTSTQTFGAPFILSAPPSAIAMSPDNRFLVVGQYNGFGTTSISGAITILDLDAGFQQQISLTGPVLALAFGAGSQALVVTGCGAPPPPATPTTTPTTPTADCKTIPGQVMLLDPLSAQTQNLSVATLDHKPLPVPLATFPANITQASTGVSGDGRWIIILAETSQTGTTTPTIAGGGDGFTTLVYHVGDTSVGIFQSVATPPLGPRAVSVNRDGTAYLAGWVLNGPLIDAQFPYALGDFRRGGHAFDYARNVIYADVPASLTEAPVMHVMDTDNLTVRERIQLPEMMTGRSLFSGDMNTLYAVSDGGILMLPVASLANAPRVTARQEDVVFQADACNRLSVSQFIDIVDPNGGRTDFTLSLPARTVGIRLSQTSGRTPARVRIDVDPGVYQNAKGTTTILLNIDSASAVNIPTPVRLLINTRDFNQRGQIINVPGKIVDMLADPVRNRLYLVRQDKNLVLVYDASTFKQVPGPELRTGNTPVGMAITEDWRYLIVGNDNSHYASVFDLETLLPSIPIAFPAYPHSIAVGHGAIWATARTPVTPLPPIGAQPLYRVDFVNRVASAPQALGIFVNGTPALDTAVLSATPSLNYIMLAEPKGTVAMWDSSVDQWSVSRKDFTALGGAYGALDDDRFVVDNNLLGRSLAPVAQLESTSGGSSGVAVAASGGFRTTTSVAAAPGTLERVDLANLLTSNGTATGEAAHLTTSLKTPPIGQIGETILPFTRTLAVPADQSSVVMLTQSGLTVLPSNFDAPTPIPSVSSVTNSADGGIGVAPGGLVTISGRGLAPQSAAAGRPPLPSALGDACVTVSGQALPLFHVSSTEIMAQLPFTASGDVPLVVHSPGGIASPFTLHVRDFAPAIFRSGQAGDQTGIATVVRDANNELVNFTNPLHPNETISIYLTGLSRTAPEATAGDAAPVDPLAIVATLPGVTLGGVALPVSFAGLVPGQVGVYQINAYVPPGVQEAVQAPLIVTQGKESTALQVRVVKP